jgi:beta-glucanase (GH16 family)
MHTMKLAPLAAAAVLGTSTLTAAARLEIPVSSNLAFEDNFDELDMKLWKHEITLGGGGNWEFQGYLNNRSNSYVDDGNLYIRPTLTADTIGIENLQGNNYIWDVWGSSPADMCTGNQFYGCQRMAGGGGNLLNPIQSARLRTAETFQFRYGKVEIRAKLPKGDWLWPAVWMLPAQNAYGQVLVLLGLLPRSCLVVAPQSLRNS